MVASRSTSSAIIAIDGANEESEEIRIDKKPEPSEENLREESTK
jgi:hypothetical protein